ncbi:hypothetical protein D3228_12840 [Leucobacter luti]|nr:hypothetical protein [Leucobacter luti]
MRRARRTLTAVLAVAVGFALPLADSDSGPAEADAGSPEYTEIHRFEPDPGYRAGYAEAIAGDYVAYADRLHESVRVTHSSGPASEWTTARLERPAPGFGEAIAMAPDASHVYIASASTAEVAVYVRSGENDWEFERALTPPEMPDRVSGYRDSFGEGLALDGDRLVVGVPNARVDRVSNTGMAFVVDLATDTWTPLIPAAPIPNSITGQSVAVRGDHVALGAVQVRSPEGARVGGVYLWDLTTLNEPLFTTQPMTDPQGCPALLPGSGPAFGISLDFDDTTLYVGSPVETNAAGADPADPETGCRTPAITAGNSTQGAVYRFDHALQQVGGKIIPPPYSLNFGGSIGVSGNALLVSSVQLPDREGEVSVFGIDALEADGTGDELTRQRPAVAQTLVASNPAPGARFGNQVFGGGLVGDGIQALIGAPDARDGAGAVYLFSPLIPNQGETQITAPDTTVEYGAHTTITATVTGEHVEGTVRGTVAGYELDPAPTDDGTAELRSPDARIDVGTYPVELSFTPAAGEAPTATTTATLTVTPLPTSTELTILATAEPAQTPVSGAAASRAPAATSDAANYPTGTALRLGGTVTDARGADPSGTVTVWDGDTRIGDFELAADGTFSMPEGNTLAVNADASFGAHYNGDANHLESDAEPLEVTVQTGPPGPTGPITPPSPPVPTPTDPDLARTGGDAYLGWLLAAAGVLLVAGGVTAWAVARRRGLRADVAADIPGQEPTVS